MWIRYAHLITTMILRDYHHPSVIMWALGQEIPTDRVSHRQFISQMLELANTLDKSRPISYSSKFLLHDPLRSSLPVNLIRTSFGDEYGSSNHMDLILDAMYHSHPQTPWIITQFGIGAKRDLPQTSPHSEKMQAQYIIRQIQMFDSKPYIAGWFLHSYRDFRSAIRSRQFEAGFNRSGLYDEFNHPKLIVKILSQIMPKYSKSVHVSRVLAPFFRPILFILYENLFCRKRNITTYRRRKKLRQFYSKSAKI